MASGVFDDALIKHLWSTDELRAIFSDRNRIQKWYDYEAALALEQAALGIIPQTAAHEIAAKARVENVDVESIAEEIRRIKHPLVPALKAVQALCRSECGEYIHFGPTTQDVLDTATVLQIKEAHAVYLRDIKAIGQSLYRLAETHKATPMVGRSHGVQALPITFGHKCAIWLSEMGRSYERLRQLEPRMFVGGMVGAVGTQALEHNEIDEIAEPFTEGKVGSSTMPHKRNPSTCEAAVAVSRALRYNAAFMLECMVIEHERDGSAWRSEWKALPESCLMAGGLLAMMKGVVSGLNVNVEKMRANLNLLGGFLLSERVMFTLSAKVGKQTAHELVYEASMQGLEQGTSFEKSLMQNPRVRAALTERELDAVLDPTSYVGRAPQIVDGVLAQTRAGGWLN
ncbi:MAG: purB [Burkholderiales bacterium]|nr:purB [Burkholderiales bacterium]